MKYCSDCGSKLEVRTKDQEWYCTSCSRHIYANPIPTIDAALFDDDGRVLLGVRNRKPGLGKLNLPGGFVDDAETFEQAIHRELSEELALKPEDYSKLVYAGSRVDSHTQDGKTRVLLIVIMIGSIKHRDFSPNDEVSKYLWKLPAELSRSDMTGEEYQHLIKAEKLWKSTTRNILDLNNK